MTKKIEMIGRKFHRLTVLKEAERARNGKVMWLCSCECGNKVVVRGDHLRGGRIKSCGCWSSNAYGVSNLDSNSPLVPTYMNMIYRCEDPKHIAYYRYGARGISVCKEWHDFKNFEKWAEENNWKPGLEVDRIDNDKGYSPTNCRVVSRKLNMRNTSVNHLVMFEGKKRCLAEIAEISGLPYNTVYARVRYGWDSENLGDPLRFTRQRKQSLKEKTNDV